MNFKIEEKRWGTIFVCPSFSVSSKSFATFGLLVTSWDVTYFPCMTWFQNLFIFFTKVLITSKKEDTWYCQWSFSFVGELKLNFDVINFPQFCWTRTNIMSCLKRILNCHFNFAFTANVRLSLLIQMKRTLIHFVFVWTAKARLSFYWSFSQVAFQSKWNGLSAFILSLFSQRR